jgi:hypothetical protein
MWFPRGQGPAGPVHTENIAKPDRPVVFQQHPIPGCTRHLFRETSNPATTSQQQQVPLVTGSIFCHRRRCRFVRYATSPRGGETPGHGMS